MNCMGILKAARLLNIAGHTRASRCMQHLDKLQDAEANRLARKVIAAQAELGEYIGRLIAKEKMNGNRGNKIDT